MPTGIGNGIAGDVFQNNLGAGGGGGLVCPSRYSWQGDGTGFGGPWGAMLSGVYDLGATSSSASIWYKPIDIRGATNLGAGLYSTDAAGVSFSGGTNIYTSPSGVLTATLGPMIFPAHPELITNGSFTEVPVGTDLIANPTFSDAASITPWAIASTGPTPRATIEPWEPRFMRLTYDLANGSALLDELSQPLNTMYSVKMRVRGVTSAGADQGSAFAYIGDLAALTSANIISNPTLTYEYQDYEFRVWSTDIYFRFYLATAAIGDVVDFDSISVKPLTMLVDNGNFGNGTTDWSNDGSSTISVGTHAGRDDVADINITGTGTGDRITQPFTWTEGKSYKVDVEVYLVSGSFRVDTTDGFVPGNFVQTTTIGSWQTLTGYITATATGPNYLFVRSSLEVSQFYVDSISIEELGEGWTLFSDVSVGEDKLICDNVAQNTSIASQSGVVPTEKSVKVSYDVVVDSGEFRLLLGSGGTTTVITTSGTYVFYETSGTGGNLVLQARSGGFDGSITNVSVEEVLSENEWHHLALSIDRDSEWKWYVDGVLTNTMDNATDVAPLSGISTLGLTNLSTAISSFYGNMTEPSLWNIPLSASEVKDIYDNMYGGQRCLGSLPFTSDLITNGNFTQIGPERITNGNFTDTGANELLNGGFDTAIPLGTAGSGWNDSVADGNTIAYSAGGVKLTVLGVSAADCKLYAKTAAGSSNVLEIGKSYKVTYEVISQTSTPVLTYYIGGWYVTVPSSIGFHTYYFTQASNQISIFRNNTLNSDITLDNISIQELGADWSIGMSDGSAQTATKYAEILASGCRIVSDDTATPYIGVQQDALEIGKNYKGSVSVTNSDTGKLRANFGSDNSNSFIDGSNTFYACNNSNISVIFLRNTNDVDTTFTNVSAKEVGQNWTVINSDSTHYVEFPGVGARFVADTLSPVLELQQLGIITPGKSYTVTCNVAYAPGSGKIKVYVGGDESSSLDEGFNTVTLTATGSDYFSIKRNDTNVDCVITNVTVTQVGGGNLERWWRMNGLEPSLITLPNVAPNGTVNDLIPRNVPIIQLDTP